MVWCWAGAACTAEGAPKKQVWPAAVESIRLGHRQPGAHLADGGVEDRQAREGVFDLPLLIGAIAERRSTSSNLPLSPASRACPERTALDRFQGAGSER